MAIIHESLEDIRSRALPHGMITAGNYAGLLIIHNTVAAENTASTDDRCPHIIAFDCILNELNGGAGHHGDDVIEPGFPIKPENLSSVSPERVDDGWDTTFRYVEITVNGVRKQSPVRTGLHKGFFRFTPGEAMTAVIQEYLFFQHPDGVSD